VCVRERERECVCLCVLPTMSDHDQVRMYLVKCGAVAGD